MSSPRRAPGLWSCSTCDAKQSTWYVCYKVSNNTSCWKVSLHLTAVGCNYLPEMETKGWDVTPLRSSTWSGTATMVTVQDFCVPTQCFLQGSLTIKHTGLEKNTANSVSNPGFALPFPGTFFLKHSPSFLNKMITVYQSLVLATACGKAEF